MCLQVEELVSSVLLVDRDELSFNGSRHGGFLVDSGSKPSSGASSGVGIDPDARDNTQQQDVAVFVGVVIHGPEHPRNELVRLLPPINVPHADHVAVDA